MKIISVVGARPNFMKIAPFIKAIDAHNLSEDSHIEHLLVHTGQHYDDRMNRAFFDALAIPDADINLGIGSGSHAEQVGKTMIAFEKVVQEEKPDWVVVVGDVNATCACSITARKEQVRLAHIEAGLRSRDMSMPEEINRLVTDRLSDLLLTPDRLSVENLRKEGVPEKNIKFVGNIMIDTLESQRHKAEVLILEKVVSDYSLYEQKIDDRVLKTAVLDGGFAVITMHRPSNVDDPDVLKHIVSFLCDDVCSQIPLIWPVHPRTEYNLKKFHLWNGLIDEANMILLHPLGYHEMLRLNMGARVMLTDSGGLQEECCVLGTPCLTLRWNTERPVTLREHGGASILVGNKVSKIQDAMQRVFKENRRPIRPELWDGRAAERIVQELLLYS
jgi:UDP-N-acetylglucosamine 2-epimerase (non-hydrolysing)